MYNVLEIYIYWNFFQIFSNIFRGTTESKTSNNFFFYSLLLSIINCYYIIIYFSILQHVYQTSKPKQTKKHLPKRSDKDTPLLLPYLTYYTFIGTQSKTNEKENATPPPPPRLNVRKNNLTIIPLPVYLLFGKYFKIFGNLHYLEETHMYLRVLCVLNFLCIILHVLNLS